MFRPACIIVLVLLGVVTPVSSRELAREESEKLRQFFGETFFKHDVESVYDFANNILCASSDELKTLKMQYENSSTNSRLVEYVEYFDLAASLKDLILENSIYFDDAQVLSNYHPSSSLVSSSIESDSVTVIFQKKDETNRREYKVYFKGDMKSLLYATVSDTVYNPIDKVYTQPGDLWYCFQRKTLRKWCRDEIQLPNLD